MIRPARQRRRAATLLELLTALSITAAMMAATMVVVRSSYASWRWHEARLDRSNAALAVVRRVVRDVRQSQGIASITAAGDPAGSLTLLRPDGALETCAFAGGTVACQVDSGPNEPIAQGVDSLEFLAYGPDGVTATTDPEEVHAIRCRATATTPDGETRTVSSYAWVRAW